MKQRVTILPTVSPVQHLKPCLDCPWSRKSLAGWLGGLTADQWIEIAKGDGGEDCHLLTNQRCAGLAIFRRNICKSPRFDTFRLPADCEQVFANEQEFKAHHEKGR